MDHTPPAALHVATLNVRGLGTFGPHVSALLTQYPADVYILTETKLPHKCIVQNLTNREAASGYCMFSTSARGMHTRA